eukprot:SAG31_NODE_419_length_15872_cov_21.857985_12_plen_44_part_00
MQQYETNEIEYCTWVLGPAVPPVLVHMRVFLITAVPGIYEYYP